MTEIILIRHAQTDHNLQRRYQGHTDTPLNSQGREQARRLAARLARDPVNAVYSSDLPRAQQTADTLGAQMSLPVLPLRGLREIDVGQAAGMTGAGLREHYPDLFGPAWAEARFPQGETHSELSERVAGTVRDITAAHPDQRVAVITHGGAIRALLSSLAGIPLEALVGLIVANTSLTRLLATDNRNFRLRVLNDAAHLDEWGSAVPGDPAANLARPRERARAAS